MSEFQFRTNEETGTVCCDNPEHLCEKCEAHFAALTNTVSAAPDPYKLHLARLRAANEHRASQFELRYKAERLAALAQERADNAARGDSDARFATLSAADLAPYRPPNSYEAALQALRAKESRR